MQDYLVFTWIYIYTFNHFRRHLLTYIGKGMYVGMIYIHVHFRKTIMFCTFFIEAELIYRFSQLITFATDQDYSKVLR